MRLAKKEHIRDDRLMTEKRVARIPRPKTEGSSSNAEAMALRRANSERLDPYGAEYFFPEIKDGEDMSMGISYVGGMEIFLQCDFSTFDEKLKSVTPEKVEQMFQYVGELEKELPEMDIETRRLVHACWRAARITRKMLGDVYTDSTERIKSYLQNELVNKDGYKIAKRNLSETKGQAMCAELSALSHDVLRRMGVDSAVFAAAVGKHPDGAGNAHAYVSLQDGRRVFDPTISNSRNESWPPAVFDTEEPLTAELLRWSEDEEGKMIQCTDIITGESRVYGSGISAF